MAASKGTLILKAQPKGGFALIEIIVSLGLLALALALGLFVSLDVYRGYQYRSERGVVVALATRARSHAMANIKQAPWGLCVTGGSYKLFAGSTYTAGAVEESIATSSAAVSGIPDCSAGAIVFTQLSGTTSPATITVTQGAAPAATITINDQGTIIW